MERRIDYELIIRAKRGDETALNAIVCRYDELIMLTASKLASLLQLPKETAYISCFEEMIKQDLLLQVLYVYDEDGVRLFG